MKKHQLIITVTEDAEGFKADMSINGNPHYISRAILNLTRTPDKSTEGLRNILIELLFNALAGYKTDDIVNLKDN